MTDERDFPPGAPGPLHYCLHAGDQAGRIMNRRHKCAVEHARLEVDHYYRSRVRQPALEHVVSIAPRQTQGIAVTARAGRAEQSTLEATAEGRSGRLATNNQMTAPGRSRPTQWRTEAGW